MSIMMNGNKPEVRSTVYAARAVLDLIFPLYRVEVRNSLIVLTRDDVEYTINRENFTEFKQILSEMFSLSLGEKEKYNPSGDMAAKIAEKLNKRHAQLAKLSG